MLCSWFLLLCLYSVSGAKTQEVSKASSSNDTSRPNLKIYNLTELRSATRNFRPDSVLGEGGFGTVFKGWVDEKTLAPSKIGVGIPVAVKKSNPDSDQGLKEWQVYISSFSSMFFSSFGIKSQFLTRILIKIILSAHN